MTPLTLKPGWKTYRFDQIAISVTDRVQPAETELEHYVGLEHLDPESLKIRRWGSPSDVIGQKLGFRKGDIIFGKRRAYQRKLAIADFDGICSAHAMVMRPKTDVVLPEFLPFFIQSDLFMNRALEISVGSLSPTINWRTLAQQEFPLPPLDEQRRITTLFLALEKVIEQCLTLYHSSEKLFRGYLYRWLSVNNNTFEFGDFPYRVEFRNIGDITPCVVPGRTKPKSFLGNTPWVTTPDITSTILDTSNVKNRVTDNELRAVGGKTVPANSILMTCVGELGVTTLVKDQVSFNQQIHAFAPTKEIVSEFLVYALMAQKRQMLSKAASTTVPYLNKKNCDSIIIPYPNMDVQRKVADFLLNFEQISNEILDHLSKAKSLKQHILFNIFG